MLEFGGKKASARIALMYSLFAAFSAVAVSTFMVTAGDAQMKSDVTIYLDRPLLDRGGTVFVIPREVAVEDWQPQPGKPNPAKSDWRLETRKPVGAQDRRLSAQISDQISIVRFDFPKGGSYDFRFLPTLDSGVAPERQGSVLLSTGNTYDYHPQTGAEMFVPEFQLFTILGPDGIEAASRALVSDVKLGYLEERYHCKEFDGALACGVQEKSK
jgi:hypothetical protein